MSDRIRNPQELDASRCVTLQRSAAEAATPVSANLPHRLFLLQDDHLQYHEPAPPNQLGDLICSVSGSRNVNLSVRYIPATDLRSEGSNTRGDAFRRSLAGEASCRNIHACQVGYASTWFDSRRTLRIQCLNAQACSGKRTLRSTDQERSAFSLFRTWRVRVVWQAQEICLKACVP
jgi:hypothetical protein